MSRIINQKEIKGRISQFVSDTRGSHRNCVVTGPSSHGKSELSEWVYSTFQGEIDCVDVQCRLIDSPLEIFRRAIDRLSLIETDLANYYSLYRQQGHSSSYNRDISITNSSNVNITSTYTESGDANSFYLFNDFLDKFKSDLKKVALPRRALIIIDNIEQSDPTIQEWLLYKLTELTEVNKDIFFLFFCRKFDKAKCNSSMKSKTLELAIRSRLDVNDIRDFFEDHNVIIDGIFDQKLSQLVARFAEEPSVLASIVKVMIGEKQAEAGTSY